MISKGGYIMSTVYFMFQLAIFGAGIAILIVVPIFAFIFLYTTPYLIWASFALHKRNLPKTQYEKDGVLKTMGRSTKFYFQLLCFKKPTL